jgi:hypothetical protein
MLRRSRTILALVLCFGLLLASRLGDHMHDASMAMAATTKFLFIPDWVTFGVKSWSFMITKDRVMKQKCSFGGGSFGGGYCSRICFEDLLRKICFENLL